MQRPLVQWERTYGPQGLTIVYVANGRKVTPDRVLEVMRADGATFPVVHDPAATTTEAYGVRAFPTAYVVGRDGNVVWQGIPHYDPSVPERAIREALEAAPGTAPPPPPR
jgi:hypothetical protein